MRLRQFFYVSRAQNAPTEFDIQKILQISRRNNRKSDITGCLLYSGQHFAQILEGDSDAVEETITRIASDSRHRDMAVAADHTISSRDFPDWSMGYLYKLHLVDRIDELLTAEHMPEDEVLALMADMRTDSVMGSL